MIKSKIFLVVLLGCFSLFQLIAPAYAIAPANHNDELLRFTLRALKKNGFICVRTPIAVGPDDADERSQVLKIIEKATAEKSKNFEFYFYDTKFDKIDVVYEEETVCTAEKDEGYSNPVVVKRRVLNTVHVKGAVGLTGVVRNVSSVTINESKELDGKTL